MSSLLHSAASPWRLHRISVAHGLLGDYTCGSLNIFPWKSHSIPSTWLTPTRLSKSIILSPQSVLEVRYTSWRMQPYPVPTTCITAFITSDCYCWILLAQWIPWSKNCLFYSISLECVWHHSWYNRWSKILNQWMIHIYKPTASGF